MGVGPSENRRSLQAGGEHGGSQGDFLHQRVTKALRSRLTSGRFAGGSKLPSLSEMAAEFDVSAMTVRRAIATLEQEGHLQRLPHVGVFVKSNTPIRKLSGASVAFVATGLASPFQMEIAGSTQRACQRQGGAVHILDGHLDAELELFNIEKLPDFGVTGAVILPPFRHPRANESLRKLHADGFPMVVVDMTLPGIHTDLVTSDHESGAYKATRHFLAKGYDSVLFVTLPPYASSVLGRIQGYERALREAGKDPLAEWKIWIEYAEQFAGYARGRKWWGAYKAVLPVFKRRPGPTAILALDAYAGWGVYEACRDLGLRVPDDVAVIAFDETEIAHAMRPSMTVIAQRCDELGRSAVELLGRRIEKGRTEDGQRNVITQVIVPVDLIERESVAEPPAVPAPE